ALLLVDVDSGKVISEQNATYPWYPASVTKLMTTYVTFKAVRDHRINLESVFTVSPNAVAQQPSKMGFKVGTRVTVDNALKMLLVHSANDMAVVLAEGVSGSIERFTEEMNAEARHLGMTQTNYVNPNGLPAERQITSARDLAILARALIREFPEYDYYWHIPAIKFGKRVTHNYNPLIERFPGADGMKTGFICASGFNLVATATRDNRRLIAVVLGAPSAGARAIKAAQMLENGFGNGSLTWLTAATGTVDELKPIDAPPPNLHEEICGKHHKSKKPRSETEEAEVGDPGSPQALMLSNLRGNAKPGMLTSNPGVSMEPVVVYIGPPKGPQAGAADPSLQAVLRAAKPGHSAASALAAGNPLAATLSSTADDFIPLPHPRPKLAKPKSAAR